MSAEIVINGPQDILQAPVPLPLRLVRLAQQRAERLSASIPVPASVRRHVSKRDATFIAAAYAIPLPGTALVAAILVGLKIAARQMRLRWRRKSIAIAGGE